MTTTTTPDLQAVERLRDAINTHDPARIAACFTDDYRVEEPHHPERGFTGNATVQRNWTRMLAAVPDITATVLRTATNDAEIWVEWEMAGAAATFTGPAIFTTRDGRIARCRFDLDRVDAPARG